MKTAQRSQRPPSLSESQWKTVELYERYGALTLDLQQRFCPTESRDAIRMCIERLRKEQWTCKTMLAGGEPCYALGVRAQRLLGMHHRPGFPFSQDGLLAYLGVATFCALARFE